MQRRWLQSLGRLLFAFVLQIYSFNCNWAASLAAVAVAVASYVDAGVAAKVTAEAMRQSVAHSQPNATN